VICQATGEQDTVGRKTAIVVSNLAGSPMVHSFLLLAKVNGHAGSTLSVGFFGGEIVGADESSGSGSPDVTTGRRTQQASCTDRPARDH